MNKKLTRIFSIALTLSILIGLLVPGSSVSAGNLTWTEIPVLDIEGLQLTEQTDANVFDIAPDGETIYAYCNTGFYTDDESVTYYLIKSTDAGKSWTYKNLDENGEIQDILDEYHNPMGITKIVISPKFATDDTIVAMCSDVIIISYDAGESWDVLDELGEEFNYGFIKDIDVAYDSSGDLCVLFGWKADKGDYYGGTGLFISRNRNRSFDLTEDLCWDNSDVIAVAFSPNYEDDETLYAVTMPNGEYYNSYGQYDDDYNYTVQLQSMVFGEDWNDDYKTGLFYDVETSSTEPIDIVDDAYIAFPSDFSVDSSSNNKIFVGLQYKWPGYDCTPDVYRVDGNTWSSSTKTVKAKSLGFYDLSPDGLSDIAFIGEYSEGTLIAADINGTVWHTSEVSSSSPEWEEANYPAGAYANLEASPIDETLFFGTASYYNYGSYFGYTTDYTTLKGLSLMSCESYSQITYSGITSAGSTDKYLWVKDVTGDNNYWGLFKSTDSGDSYELIYANLYDDFTPAGGPAVRVSPDYTDDQTIYIVTTNKYIMKSTDGGDTFTSSKVYVPDGAIKDFYLIDASNYYVGGSDGIYKNNGKLPVIEIEELDSDGYSIKSIDDDWFVIKDNSGQIFLSTDGASTFDMIVDLGDYSLQLIDKASQTFYATYGGDVYKFIVDESSNWELIGTAVYYYDDDDNYNELNIKTMAVKGDIVYVSVYPANYNEDPVTLTSIADYADDAQAYRLVGLPGDTDLGPIGFEAVKGSSIDDLGGTLSGGPYFAPIYVTDADTPVSYILYSWTDVMGTGPALVSPASGEDTRTEVTLTWSEVTKAKKYEIQIANNSTFSDATSYTSTSTFLYLDEAENLTNGLTYYWRVRVAKGYPLMSPWSETGNFTVKLGRVSDYMTIAAPTAGDTDVDLTPTFQWTAIDGADKYEIQLADNPNFTGAQTGSVTATAWVPGTTLNYSTTYYWRVRAVNNDTYSDWVTGVFTTMAEPVVEPTPTPTPEAEQYFDSASGKYFDSQEDLQAYQAAHADDGVVESKGTPAYIWVVIAISAVLVIAVIVLIIRTRKQ